MVDDRKAEPYSAEELAMWRVGMEAGPLGSTWEARREHSVASCFLATLAQRDDRIRELEASLERATVNAASQELRLSQQSDRIRELEAHVPCPACTARTVGLATEVVTRGQQQASQLGGNILLSALAKLNSLGVTQTLGQSEQQDAMLLQWPANRLKA